MAEENAVRRYMILSGEDDYFAWSKRTEAELVSRNCWNAVEPGFGDNPNADELRIDRKARAYILSVVNDNILQDVGDLGRAREVWETLREIYATFTLLHSVINLKEMVNVKKTSQMSMADYFATIQRLHQKLLKGGITFTDSSIAMVMLAGLPLDEYEGVVRSLEDNQEISTLAVKRKLLAEEKRLTRRINTGEEEVQAMRATHSNYKKKDDTKQTTQVNSNQASGSSNTYKCFKCGKVGHVARYCRNDVTCYSCNGKGHVAKDCEGARKVKEVVNMKVGTENVCKENWYLDSCASYHMCPFKEYFSVLESSVEGTVKLGDDSELKIEGRGKVAVKMKSGVTVQLSDVLYVPKLGCSLLSVGVMTQKGFDVVFSGEEAKVTTKNDKNVLFTAVKKNNVYEVSTSSQKGMKSRCNLVTETEDKVTNAVAYRCNGNLKLWHDRLGHVNEKTLMKHPVLNLKSDENFEQCSVCIEGKMCKKSVKKFCERKAEKVLDVVHSDVVGKLSPKSKGGSEFAVTMIDEYSRYVTAYPLKHKSEVAEKFKSFQVSAEKLHDTQLKVVQSDGGGE